MYAVFAGIVVINLEFMYISTVPVFTSPPFWLKMRVVIEISFPAYTAVSFIEMIVVVFSGVYVLFLNVQSSLTVPPYTAPYTAAVQAAARQSSYHPSGC